MMSKFLRGSPHADVPNISKIPNLREMSKDSRTTKRFNNGKASKVSQGMRTAAKLRGRRYIIYRI